MSGTAVETDYSVLWEPPIDTVTVTFPAGGPIWIERAPRVLAVDLDGTIADWTIALWYQLGRPLNPHTYDMLAAYPHVDPQRITDLFADPRFYRGMFPVKDAVGVLSALAETWTIWYTSSRVYTKDMWQATKHWLYEHGFPEGDLTIGMQEKARHAAVGGALVLIDDCPGYAAGFAALPDKYALIFQDPAWPYGLEGYGQAIPVSYWGYVPDILEGLGL